MLSYYAYCSHIIPIRTLRFASIIGPVLTFHHQLPMPHRSIRICDMPGCAASNHRSISYRVFVAADWAYTYDVRGFKFLALSNVLLRKTKKCSGGSFDTEFRQIMDVCVRAATNRSTSRPLCAEVPMSNRVVPVEVPDTLVNFPEYCSATLLL